MEVLGYNLVVPTPLGAAHVRSAGRTGGPSLTHLFKVDTEPNLPSAGHCAPGRNTKTLKTHPYSERTEPRGVRSAHTRKGDGACDGPSSGSSREQAHPQGRGGRRGDWDVRGVSLAVTAGGAGQTRNNLLELWEQTHSGDCQRLSTDAG